MHFCRSCDEQCGDTQPLLVARTQAVTELAFGWTTARHFSTQGFLQVDLLNEHKDTKGM